MVGMDARALELRHVDVEGFQEVVSQGGGGGGGEGEREGGEVASSIEWEQMEEGT